MRNSSRTNILKAGLFMAVIISIAACQTVGTTGQNDKTNREKDLDSFYENGLPPPRTNTTVNSTASYSFPISASTEYDGIVSPIDKPILVKLRPYPRSKMTKRTIMKMSNGEKSVDLITETNGSTRVEKNNSSINFILELENMTIRSGEREKNVGISGKFIISTTESGEILGFKADVKSPKPTNQNKEDPEKIAQSLKLLMPVLPRSGLLTGQDVYERNAAIFEKLNKAAGSRLMDVKGIVRGSTTYNSRYSIVVDYKGLLMGMDLSGYGIMDAYSGAWVYTSMKMKPGEQVIAKFKGAMGFAIEVGEIHLSPSTPRYNFTPIAPANDVVVQPAIEKPMGKAAENRLSELKRLLDAGLITEEEAAKKRQEILDGI